MEQPPNDWVGELSDDGYEYIEFPMGSGQKWYRQSGTKDWYLWRSESDKANSAGVIVEQQGFTTDTSWGPALISPTFSSSHSTPTRPTDPPSNSSQSHGRPVAPPSHPPPTMSAPRTMFSEPQISPPPLPQQRVPVDNFARYEQQYVSTPFNSTNRSSRKSRVLIVVPIAFALMIVLSGVLYVWASDLAEESDTGDLVLDNDSDGVEDSFDNCMYDYNPSQSNFDGDSFGDVCDSDIDNDGHSNHNDFNDYGDGVLIFKWTYARIDDSETYDSDGSGPDVYAVMEVDWDSDGETDSTYTSGTTDNIKEWSNLWERQINPTDSRDSIKVSIKLYDEDYSSDDILDYVSGSSYNYYTFTIPLSESYYDSDTYDGRDDDKGLRVTFTWDVSTD